MSTYRQLCPSCARELELPADAVGRLAKCPACQATFRIGDPAAAKPTAASEAEPASQVPPVENTPNEPSQHSPFSKPVIDLGGQSQPVSGVTNPYQPTTQVPEPIGKIGELEIVARPIEDIVSPTLSIFGARWAPMILSFLIIFAAAAVLTVVPFIAIALIADSGSEAFAIGLMLFFVPIAMLLAAYATVGLSRVALAVARDHPQPLAEILPPLNLVGRFLLGMIAMTLSIGFIFAIAVGAVFALSMIAPNEGIMVGLSMLMFGALFIVSILAQWLLWPWIFVVSDGKASALGSIRAAYEIAINNKLTSALLILLSMVLSMIGSTLCYVGQIATTPLTMLMFAVAYLVMTNQPIQNPKAQRAY